MLVNNNNMDELKKTDTESLIFDKEKELEQNIFISEPTFSDLKTNTIETENNYIKKKEEIAEQKLAKLEEVIGFNAGEWGYISAVANFASVVCQLYTTFKTQKTKSFSMLFIVLLTFLNFVYVFLGLLTENIGMVIACGVFVLYNLIIVYFYYFGK
tara:strand:+ start:411 stop:878 length:468 start_codon:yes stop_codon:yes gene_type:complete